MSAVASGAVLERLTAAKLWLVSEPSAGGAAAIAAGLGSTATIGQLSGLRAQSSDASAEIADLVSSAVRV